MSTAFNSLAGVFLVAAVVSIISVTFFNWNPMKWGESFGTNIGAASGSA